MIETRLIGEIGELESLIGEWDRLWRRSPTATPFQSPAWLIAWRRLFAPGELRCAAAFAGGELVGLAPFYLERGQHGTRLTPLGVSLSDYLDVLVDPRAPEAAAALASQLARTEWEECRFEALAPEAVALRLPTPPGVKDAEDAQESCPVVPMAGADLAGFVPARQRRKLRRARAAAERRGRAIVVSHDSADVFLDALFALHQRRWEQRGERGVLAEPRVQAFHRAALPGLMAAGIARALTLDIDGRAVGAYYGFQHRDRAYAYIGGLDPEFEEASPGALTIEAAMQRAASEGAREFHFLRGREPYKFAWGARDRWNRLRVWTRHV